MALTEREIFLQAIQLESDSAVRAWLDRACGEDPQLRSAVEALLKAHRNPDNPLDKPRVASAGKIAREADLGDLATAGDARAESDLGRQIGPYRIRELIGEGGFGLVYVATQETPVRRRVALKILKPGMGSREIVARFEAERQAVAMMNHPNIAQIFDAGVTEEGRPYFAMELVKGRPITEFLRRHPMTLRDRVRLFIDVCRATHHAHQKGIIHRDLKPSNVLISLHDGKPVVKIIDFGVAKAVDRGLTDKTIYTRFFSMIGTPSYMSPEQAAMSGLDVDTRSDIYSLGVLLYELLTGVTPFDRHRLNSATYDEMRKIICEEEPPRPSLRLTTLSQSTGETVVADSEPFADQGSAREADRVESESIPRDLDWIAMRALEKDRNRRYESAAALAADLNRWLVDEPVEARPPSRWYRMQKFARRNRVTLMAGSAVVLAMAIGTIVSVDQALQAIEQRNQKEQALQKAIEARQYVENFAERLKTANLLIHTATQQERAERWDDADRAISEAIDLVPNYYLVWVHRGRLGAERYRWPSAADDFAEALKLEAPFDQADWMGVGALFQTLNRGRDYRDLYDRSLALLQAQDNEAEPDWQSLRACIIAPQSDEDADWLAALADEFLRRNPGRFGGPGPQWPGRPEMGNPRRPVRERRGPGDGAARPPTFPPRRQRPPDMSPGDRPRPMPDDLRFRDPLPRSAQLALAAWAHLQAGHLDRAERLLSQARSDRGWPGHFIMDSLDALGWATAGRSDDAEAALKRAEHSLRQWLDSAIKAHESGEAGPRWFEVAEGWLAFRQAYRMIRDAEPNLPESLLRLFRE